MNYGANNKHQMLMVSKLFIKDVLTPSQKREQDFPKIYDLHVNQGLHLAKISREYGWSRHYIKRVLTEPMVLKNQFDKIPTDKTMKES